MPKQGVVRMFVESKTVTFEDYRNAVDGQIQAGFMFGQIEDFINACTIGEEEKTALWVRAWRRQAGDGRPTASTPSRSG